MKKRWHVVGDIIAERNYSEGVELGVREGRFVKHLLARFPALRMTGIDPWEVKPRRPDEGAETYEGWPIARHMAQAFAVAKAHPDRCKMIRTTSSKGSEMFPDQSVDFVFIDADHTAEAVRRDIDEWTPKIKPGGLLCGHDIHWPSVRLAVLSRVPENELITKEDHVWLRFLP